MYDTRGGSSSRGCLATRSLPRGRRTRSVSPCPGPDLPEVVGTFSAAAHGGNSPDVVDAFTPHLTWLVLQAWRLTMLVAQARHKTRIWVQTSWSEGFDPLVRNEGITGPNPMSSTIPPSAAPCVLHTVAHDERLSGREVLSQIVSCGPLADLSRNLCCPEVPNSESPRHAASKEVQVGIPSPTDNLASRVWISNMTWETSPR